MIDTNDPGTVTMSLCDYNRLAGRIHAAELETQGAYSHVQQLFEKVQKLEAELAALKAPKKRGRKAKAKAAPEAGK